MKLVALSLLVLNLLYLGYYFSSEEAVLVSAKSRELGNIQLLSEVETSDKDIAMTNVMENPIRASVGSSDDLGCMGVGPFTDVFSGQNAIEQLNAMDVLGVLKAIDVLTGESDYRVLIPPASSAEEAFRKLRELQASNIDSYVITQGEQAMGISLGVFSSQDGAETLLTRLKSMGYEAEIIQIERQSRSYWIVLEAEEFRLPEVSNWMFGQESVESKQMICAES
jgi:hypothetical protein